MPVPVSFTGEGTNPRWAISLDEGNSLPSGLTFANGVFSGTPTTATSADFLLRLTATTEDGDVTISKRCSITTRLPRLTITSTCPLPAGTVGQTYSRTLQAAGARGPFRWNLLEGEALPPGLALSPEGAVSGIPALVPDGPAAGPPGEGARPRCPWTHRTGLRLRAGRPGLAGVGPARPGPTPTRWSRAGPT